MRRKHTGLLCLLLGLIVSSVLAAELPQVTKNLCNLLGKAGYQYDNVKDGIAYFTRWHSIVAVKLNRDGIVTGGGITFDSRANYTQAEEALSLIFAALQVNMGKAHGLDSKVFNYKIRKLVETIATTLKTVPKTEFPFSDVMVMAERDSKDGYVSIFFRPW